MAGHDFNAPRLYCEAPLASGTDVIVTPEQTNYLRNVLRLGVGDEIRIFNGVDGEWRAVISMVGKRACTLTAAEQIRGQSGGPDVHYLFAPLKRARLDYVVQKATELGVAAIRPVFTQHTVVHRVNLARMRANVIEAAEQCGVLRLPDVAEPAKLEMVVSAWQPERALVFADEGAEITDPLAALAKIGGRPAALLIGPEGGFSEAERDLLLRQDFTVRISLGPRIMRADTAAVAALALINVAIGDWQ